MSGVESGFNPEEDRSSFSLRISEFSPASQELVMYAYDFAKVAHHGQMREGGERYFEHVRNVALIMLDEFKIEDPELVSIALLHDAGEDSQIFGSTNGKKNSDWREKASERIELLFGPRIAKSVLCITKPYIDEVEIKSKKEKNEFYHDQLLDGGSDSIIVKAADRLHNLRTLGFRSRENQIKIVNETRIEYYPLFQSISDIYPEQVAYLIPQMEKAISTLAL